MVRGLKTQWMMIVGRLADSVNKADNRVLKGLPRARPLLGRSTNRREPFRPLYGNDVWNFLILP